jgi:hypothetical protein
MSGSRTRPSASVFAHFSAPVRMHVPVIMWMLLLVSAMSVFAVAPASAEDAIPLIYVSIPSARLASWEDADGVFGRRFVEQFGSLGTIHRPDELPMKAQDALSRWKESVRDAVVYLDHDASDDPSHDDDPSVPDASSGVDESSGEDAGRARAGLSSSTHFRQDRLLHLGPDESPILLRWVGTSSDRGSALLESLLPGHQAWLDEGNALRWEEVGEFIDLTLRENTALRRLEAPGHPLWLLRESFANDKRTANLALYLSRSSSPRALGLELDLAAVYEGPVRHLWRDILEEDSIPAVVVETSGLAGADLRVQIASERRLFARRLEGSRGRVYGRLDRVLQSLYGELEETGILVIDARESLDPFVATIGRDVPAQWWNRIPPAP